MKKIKGPSLDLNFLILNSASHFLAAAFAGQCLFDALFLSRLQVEGVFLHFLDDVFLLDLPLETP